MAHPININDNSFQQEVLDSDQPVLVDFWAEWCGPCKLIAPLVDELAQEYDGKVKFAKVNVDDNPKTAMEYGIRGIPTMLIFKGGRPVKQVVGAVAKSVLQESLEEATA
ncbi:MAG: thioredoxin [SAR202 cluster bacterium Casp-Chloro-G4]|nr:thioredoxin [Chloroflexota bacterium]PKB61567.1 MAG: thioredoxin [SAR202 cluster bacterium Casp-Chloro-G4]